MACNQPHREGFVPLDPADERVQLSLSTTRALRTRRAEFFDAELFSDPAWDILLLLASEPHRTGISVAEVAESLGYPPSVTGRWLKILGSKGEVEVGMQDTAGDPLYRLTDKAFAALVNLFAGVCETE
ncbi:MAG: hypothetical protein QM676_13065 [Novosphingobium sp.]